MIIAGLWREIWRLATCGHGLQRSSTDNKRPKQGVVFFKFYLQKGEAFLQCSMHDYDEYSGVRGGSRVWEWSSSQCVWGQRSLSGAQGQNPRKKSGTLSFRSWSSVNRTTMTYSEQKQKNILPTQRNRWQFYIQWWDARGGFVPTQRTPASATGT